MALGILGRHSVIVLARDAFVGFFLKLCLINNLHVLDRLYLVGRASKPQKLAQRQTLFLISPLTSPWNCWARSDRLYSVGTSVVFES